VFCYRIAEPGTPDLESWHRLRTDLYLASGLITADDIDSESGYFVDTYDDHSIHLLAAHDDDGDIGCWRMVEPASGRILPVTELFGIDVLPNAWESSGSAVLPAYRKTPVTLGFYRALFSLAEEKGYENAYGIVEQPYLDAALRNGYPIEVVGEPRFVFNAQNVATLTRRSALVSVIEAPADDAPAFAAYFRKPFDWTLSSGDLKPVG
jgi:N-acyl-L-homoserine lactone synthetase